MWPAAEDSETPPGAEVVGGLRVAQLDLAVRLLTLAVGAKTNYGIFLRGI